jgi:hypothetical protein
VPHRAGAGLKIRKVGTDGFRIHYKPTLKKVVSDRRASLDEKTEINPAMRNGVKAEFDRGRTIPVVYFPSDGAEVQDSPKLTLVVMASDTEWSGVEPAFPKSCKGAIRLQLPEIKALF